MSQTRRLPHMRSRAHRAGPLVATVIAVGVFLLTGSGLAFDLPETMTGAAYVGDGACMECHEELSQAMTTGVHGMVEEFQVLAAQTGCEGCHGPGSLHVDSNEIEDIINPATADADMAAQLCLQCHRNDHLDGYEMSLHSLSEVTCANCHSVHGPQRAGLLKAAEPDLCIECHSETQARMSLPSHHPIKEGKMVCSDCHDPHRGELATQMAGERSTDLCLGCHSSKQGPFIFEHDPVIEDCAICHDPHGTVANNLLKQNEPFLCLQCHQTHFHATLQGIEGEFVSLDGFGGTSHRDSAKKAMLTKCTQCHTEIHGSDLPSETISGGGRALTR